jgi:hypothetical protein
MLINAVDQGPVQVKQQCRQIGTATGASCVALAHFAVLSSWALEHEP